MYHAHFGLSQSPFSITPNPDFFYSGSKRGDILEALIYAVTHGEGIIKVTGEVGSGKTMLCRMLAGMMPENVEVIFLVNPTLNREEVMFTLAGELEINTEGKRPDEVIRLLHQDLISKHINGKQVVLLVEEAQAMPFETLEEIRLFSNLETAHHKLLQIVLFGQPELDVNLSQSHMRQLKERITHSFKVPPMDTSVISDFLMFRMRTAGYHGPDLFTKDAIKLLADVSEGIIRRINILADKALLAAFSENTHAIQAKHVRAAIADSEFTPNKKKFPSKFIWLAGVLLLILIIESFLIGRQYWSKSEQTPSKNTTETSQLIQSETKSKTKSEAKSEAKPDVYQEDVEKRNTTISVPALAASTSASTSAPEELKQTSVEQTKIEASPSVSTLTTLPALQTLPIINPNSPIAEWPNKGMAKQRAEKSKAWLSARAKSDYTIQLSMISAMNYANFEQFISKVSQDLTVDQLYLYPSNLGGSPRYGIVYSSFPTREEAQKKRLEIEKKWSLKAQLRTISGLQYEMKKTKSENLW